MKLIITDIKNPKFNISGEHKIISPENEVKPCIGCFSCWVKTPGRCAIHDGYENTGIDMSKCDELIIVSECRYGSVSSFVKAVQDRAISYIHPCFVIKKGEMHHKRRYENTITMSAYFYGSNITDSEKENATELMQSNADNYNGELHSVSFYNSVQELEGITL
ncbi:MAG: flavodoxin family protein [Ruminococcus sp.]|nr:flavodoxin family protein [Ruminococcus sp.]